MRRGAGYDLFKPEEETSMFARVQPPLKMLPQESLAVLLNIDHARELEWLVKTVDQEYRLLQAMSGLFFANDVEQRIPETRR